MSFPGVLFRDAAERREVETARQPDCFADLNLDQVVAAIVAGREEYDLKPFFHLPLKSVVAVEYRQAVVRDLQSGANLAQVKTFTASMRRMREQLASAEKSYHSRQKQRWFLEAVDTYGAAVGALAEALRVAELRSEALQGLRDHLACYIASPAFTARVAETARIKRELSGVRYRLYVEGLRIAVSRYDPEPDYGEQVARTFEKFRPGPIQDYEFELRDDPHMNHVEAAVLDRVALVFPEIFAALEHFCREQANYMEATVQAFDREVQFYVATLELFERMKKAALPCCLPTVGEVPELDCHGLYDLSLALQLKAEAGRLVLNDFYLRGPERILVVSGANQGGKTTFARTVGQLHYLASLGCPVAAADARLFLFDRLFTHFEREEDLRTLRSKLEDDLVRIHSILRKATSRSLIIMNESFSSATLADALFLGKEVMKRVSALGLICVFVTFLDELSTLGEQCVSMVSTVQPGEAAQRSFKILRMPADGLAYAAAVAEKYRLGYDSVKRRIAP